MAVAAPKKPVEAPKLVPPCQPDRYVDVGMLVQWLPGPGVDEKPIPAVVTAVGLETIDCNIIHPGLGNLFPYRGVHHYVYQKEKMDQEGGWRHLPLYLAMLKAMIAAGELAWDGDSKYVVVDKPVEDKPAISKPIA